MPLTLVKMAENLKELRHCNELAECRGQKDEAEILQDSFIPLRENEIFLNIHGRFLQIIDFLPDPCKQLISCKSLEASFKRGIP